MAVQWLQLCALRAKQRYVLSEAQGGGSWVVPSASRGGAGPVYKDNCESASPRQPSSPLHGNS